MKRKCLLVLLALLALALAAAPALAGTLSASNTVTFTLTFTGPNIDGGSVDADASYVQGAYVSSDFASDFQPVPGTAVASLAATPIFVQTQATTTYVDSVTFELSTVSLMANGPSGDTITQQAYNWLSYVFAPPGGGTYTATLTGTFDPAFSLAGNEVNSSTSFNSVAWSSILSASLTTDNFNNNGGGSDSLVTGSYAASTDGSLPDYLLNTSFFSPGSFTFDLGTLTVGDGDTVFLDVTLLSSLDGTTSQVPVPPSLVLLGTGLAGLVLTRRRHSRG